MNRIASYITEALSSIYEEREIKSLIFIICKDLLQQSELDIYLRKDIHLSPALQKIMEESVERLKNHEPIQYVCGKTEFCGLTFEVTPDVLIPRPETEELVEMVCTQQKDKSNLQILDIGTGSGCIAISLKHRLKNAEVKAWDISPKAIEVARRNAQMLKTEVHFEQHDVFADLPKGIRLDVIVSNPPYIAEHEREQMEANVLEWEPDGALFVPDSDPLRFYRRIAETGCELLSDKGKIYVEINQAYGPETVALFRELGYTHVELFNDLYHNNRIVTAKR